MINAFSMAGISTLFGYLSQCHHKHIQRVHLCVSGDLCDIFAYYPDYHI